MRLVSTRIAAAIPALALASAVLAAPLTVAPAPLAGRPDAPSVVTFFALGDWGQEAGPGERDKRGEVIDLVATDLAGLERTGRDTRPFVLGLGDNIYPVGTILKKGEADIRRWFGEPYGRLRFAGRGLEFHVVHGNHDYYGDPYVWETIGEGLYPCGGDGPILHSYAFHHPRVPDTNDEAEWWELRYARRDREIICLPQGLEWCDGAPPLVNLVALDSQRMIEAIDQGRDEDVEAMWAALAVRLGATDARWNLIIGHHPAATYGHHAGGPYDRRRKDVAYTLARPLRLLDLGDPAVDTFAVRLREIAEAAPVPTLYLSGHDHNLQLIRVSDRFVQVVSGSASKVSDLPYAGPDLLIGEAEPGMVRLDATPDSLWLTYVWVDETGARHDEAFRVTAGVR